MKTITNEQMAKKIAEESKQYFYHDEYECGLACAKRMAKLKDKQHEQEKQRWIDKAVEWVDNNVNHYIFENEHGETYIKYTFTEDFIKTMKGE